MEGIIGKTKSIIGLGLSKSTHNELMLLER